MNSKKLKTQLLAAVAMTLVAVIALGSSTLAWFANNTKVEATGMNVVAKSNDTFLLISKEKTSATDIQKEGATTVDLGMTAASEIFPAAPAMTDTQADYLTTAGKKVGGGQIATAGVKIGNAETAGAVTNWYTAKAKNAGTHEMKDDSARQLETFTDYVEHKTLYMTVAQGADGAKELKVTPTFTQNDTGNDIDAVKVLLVTSDGACEVLKNGTTTAVDISGANTTLTEGTVLTVDLYIYVDGDDDAVFTNNKANLKGATIKLDFSVDVATTV